MDSKERERIHNLIKRIRSYLYVHQRAARIASLVMSLVLIFTSVSGLVYPSIKNEDYATGSRASGEVASGEAVDVNVSSGTDKSDDAGQDVTTGEKEGQASGQVAGIHGGNEKKASGDETNTIDATDNSVQNSVNEADTAIAVDQNAKEAVTTQEKVSGFDMVQKVDGINVRVTADEGVLPSGATMEVKTLIPEERIRVEAAVEEAVGDDRQVESFLTFDITIYDEYGNEIQPDVSKGDIRVAFETDILNEHGTRADIYHIKDLTAKENDESNSDKDNPDADSSSGGDLPAYVPVEGITGIHVSDPDLRVDRLETKVNEVHDKSIASARTDGFSVYTLTITRILPSPMGTYTLTYESGNNFEFPIVFDFTNIANKAGLTGTAVSKCVAHNDSPYYANDPDYFELYTSNNKLYLKIKKYYEGTKNVAFHMNPNVGCAVFGLALGDNEAEEEEEQEEEQAYGVLVWQFSTSSTAKTVSDKAQQLFEETANVTVTRFNGTTLTDAQIENAHLVYIVDTDNAETENSSLIASDANAAVLKKYVNKGGRVVMQGENPYCTPTGNKYLSQLAAKIGGSFTITTKMGGLGLKKEFNSSSQLAKGAENLYPNCVSDIETSGDAVWVARLVKTDVNDQIVEKYNYIVDQPAGKGRITALSDWNWFVYQTFTSEQTVAAQNIFVNLLKDSAANIKRVSANPKMDMYFLSPNPSSEEFVYRIKNKSTGEPITDIVAVDSKTGEKLTVKAKGWVRGTGNTIDIYKVTPNTEYIWEWMDANYINNDGDVYDPNDPSNNDIETQTSNIVTAIDPHDYTEVNGETVSVKIHRASDASTGGDPTKDTVVVTNIHDSNLRFALQYETGQIATEFVKPILDEEKSTQNNKVYRVTFDGENRIFGDSPCYLIAKDPSKNNKLSGYVRIPACILINEWMYDDADTNKTYSITDDDYVVKTENVNLVKGESYNITSDQESLSVSESGMHHIGLSYNKGLSVKKYVSDDVYSDAYSDIGTLDKIWIVHKQVYGNVEKDIYISTEGTPNGDTSISKYVLPGGTLDNLESGGDLSDNGYINTMNIGQSNNILYSIKPHEYGVDGYISVSVHGANNTEDYTVKLNLRTVEAKVYAEPTPEPTQSPTPVPVSPGGGTAPAPAPAVTTPAPTLSPTLAPTVTPSPEAPKNHKTEVVLLNGKYIQEARANGLSGFTDAQPEDDVTVRLEISEKNADDLEAKTAGRFRQIHKRVYENEKNKNVKKHYLEMLVTKQVDGEEPQRVTDLGDVIEIALTYDQLSDEEPLVIREHGGYASEMKELFRRPTGNYEDGTFYVSGDGVVYVYARYFSEYAVSYVEMADDGTVVKKDDGPGTTPSKSSVTWSGSSPETGDRMPLLFVWIMMLTSGLILLAYAMGFIGVRAERSK